MAQIMASINQSLGTNNKDDIMAKLSQFLNQFNSNSNNNNIGQVVPNNNIGQTNGGMAGQSIGNVQQMPSAGVMNKGNMDNTNMNPTEFNIMNTNIYNEVNTESTDCQECLKGIKSMAEEICRLCKEKFAADRKNGILSHSEKSQIAAMASGTQQEEGMGGEKMAPEFSHSLPMNGQGSLLGKE
jgi:hypothetical protein